MKKFVKQLALSLSLSLLAPFAANAAGSITGTVASIYALPMSMVVMNGTPTGTPSCASTNPNRWAMDPTTANGQGQIALIRFAAALGKTVAIIGTGTCSLWTDTETVASILVTN